MTIETTAKTLYARAYSLYENKEYDKLLETCSQLLNEFPKSKEARWAAKNFPINYERDEGKSTLKLNLKSSDRTNNDLIGAAVLAMPVIVIVANVIFRKYYGYHGDSRPINDFLGYSLLLIVGAIIVGFFQYFKLKKQKKDYEIYSYGILANIILGFLIMLIGPVL